VSTKSGQHPSLRSAALAAEPQAVRRLASACGDAMKRAETPGIVFIALGAAFVAIGISGQRAFLAIGVAFLVIGFAIFFRQRRTGGST
jgi:hypothetical protein